MYINLPALIVSLFLMTVVGEKLTNQKYKLLYLRIAISLGYLIILSVAIFGK